MKKILILLVIIFTFSCNCNKKKDNKSKTNQVTESKNNFDWLLGKWKRNNEEQGKETFENWSKISDSKYTGIGYTMKDGDTIKQENISLIKSGNQWNLTVKVPEESQPIFFEMIDQKENSFVCKNDSIDFPNKIKYWKNKDKINASVSSSEMEIEFEFEKIK
ncbi:MAG: hypothetical protein HRT66_10775 [Flavobacteriaceae bacterium]|nr:hypothetical protein [Flavobacteriaceae bacterium]